MANPFILELILTAPTVEKAETLANISVDAIIGLCGAGEISHEQAMEAITEYRAAANARFDVEPQIFVIV